MIRTIYLSILTTMACGGLIFSLSTSMDLNAAPIVLAAITTGLIVTLVNVVSNTLYTLKNSKDKV